MSYAQKRRIERHALRGINIQERKLETVEQLKLIERDGDLHLAPGAPGEIARMYAALQTADFIEKGPPQHFGFWRLTPAGVRLVAAVTKYSEE